MFIYAIATAYLPVIPEEEEDRRRNGRRRADSIVELEAGLHQSQGTVTVIQWKWRVVGSDLTTKFDLPVSTDFTTESDFPVSTWVISIVMEIRVIMVIRIIRVIIVITGT